MRVKKVADCTYVVTHKGEEQILKRNVNGYYWLELEPSKPTFVIDELIGNGFMFFSKKAITKMVKHIERPKVYMFREINGTWSLLKSSNDGVVYSRVAYSYVIYDTTRYLVSVVSMRVDGIKRINGTWCAFNLDGNAIGRWLDKDEMVDDCIRYFGMFSSDMSALLDKDKCEVVTDKECNQLHVKNEIDLVDRLKLIAKKMTDACPEFSIGLPTVLGFVTISNRGIAVGFSNQLTDEIVKLVSTETDIILKEFKKHRMLKISNRLSTLEAEDSLIEFENKLESLFGVE